MPDSWWPLRPNEAPRDRDLGNRAAFRTASFVSAESTASERTANIDAIHASFSRDAAIAKALTLSFEKPLLHRGQGSIGRHLSDPLTSL